jgi:hypothetical protein
VFPVAFPTYADAVYVRVPDRTNTPGAVCRFAVIPVEFSSKHQIAGIDRLVAGGKLLAEEYFCTDGSRQMSLMMDPRDLLGPLRGVTPERIPVLNPPKYLEDLIRDGDTDPAEVFIESVEEQPGTVKEIQVERKNSLQDLQLTLTDDLRGVTRIRVLPGNDPGVTAVVPDFVKIDILREDATRSTLLFQNHPIQSDTLLLPPVQLRNGDKVHLKFLNGRSGS